MKKEKITITKYVHRDRTDIKYNQMKEKKRLTVNSIDTNDLFFFCCRKKIRLKYLSRYLKTYSYLICIKCVLTVR